MRILIVCQYYYPEPFSISDVAEGLVKMGHEVLVVTGKPNYGFGKIMDGYENVVDEVIRGVRVHRCSLKPRKKGRKSIIANYLSFWWNSKRYLRRMKEEFDVVYSMSLSPLTSIVGGTIYAKKHHVRHVLHCLDLWPESTVVTGAIKEGSLPYRILFRWCRSIYKRLDQVLVSSPSFTSYFREVLHLNDLPISYVPQPPTLGHPSETVDYDHRYNFVYAGNIGTLQLVEALVLGAERAAKEEDICLHLIGMGARSDAVKALIEEHHLEERVRFYGVKSRDVTASYYQKATGIAVTLAASARVGKTIPSKLNSALSYARPILACIHGDGEDVLRDSGGAVFAESETPEALAEAMLKLCRMKEEEREELGKKNKAYFDEHYDTQRVVSEIFTYLKN